MDTEQPIKQKTVMNPNLYKTYLYTILCILFSINTYAQDILVQADFNNCKLPNDWSVKTYGGEASFEIGIYEHDSLAQFNGSIDNSCMFFVDDDVLGEGTEAWRLEATTPTFDGTLYGNVSLNADIFFRNYDGVDFLRILVFNGLEYVEIDRFQGQNYTGETFNTAVNKTYDLSPYINCDMSVIFEYNDGGTWGWYNGFDNVVITGNNSTITTLNNYNFDACNSNGWTTQTLEGTQNWAFSTSKTLTGGTCTANFVDSDATPFTKAQIISPTFNGLGSGRVYLTYKMHFSQRSNINETNKLLNYSYLKSLLVDGTDTTVLAVYQGSNSAYRQDTFDITAYKSTSTKIIFEYADNGATNSGFAAVDDIQIYTQSTIANEACSNAIPLQIDVPCTIGCNIGAYLEGPLPNCVADNKSGVWYEFVATTNAVTVTMESNFNDVLTAFSGSCNGLTQIACTNVDAFGFEGETLKLSNLTIGNTYYIRVSGADCTYGNPEGSFCINLSSGVTNTTPPPNDNCAGAITLNTGNTCLSNDNMTATFSNNIPSCNENADMDLWYRFQMPPSSLFITTQAEFAEVITIYQGSCGNLTEVACADYGHDLSLPNLTTGSFYYVQLSGAFATLRGNVCISTTSNCEGVSCDDDNDITINDAFDASCTCVGEINCPTLGQACDDNNTNTINDIVNGDCNCEGTCLVEGTSCNDNNPNTINDIYTYECDCVGTCPPAGTICNDNNPNTINDAFDANCNCVGDSCPQNITINDDFLSGNNTTYQASNEIDSDSDVENGANIIYDAGVRVRLTEGFHAKNGSFFNAFIEGCDENVNISYEISNCQDSLNLAGNITSGNYGANHIVESDGNVTTGNFVLFKAADHIHLKPNFDVPINSELTIDIDSCKTIISP